MAIDDHRRRAVGLRRDIEPHRYVAAETEDVEIGGLDAGGTRRVVAAPELFVQRALLLDRPGGERLVESRILVGGEGSDIGIQHPRSPNLLQDIP